ncbi:MAG: hypothetical protein JSV36_22495 [Anaerolineae bacterium]|nr:MAG: hypothetical protein JSV36_22495 [Anaerolineae bacterium]
MWFAGRRAAGYAIGYATAMPSMVAVEIDIKPDSYPNSINPKSQGKIPVAILSTPDLWAPVEVDPGSLTFGHTGDEGSLAFCNPSPEDVEECFLRKVQRTLSVSCTWVSLNFLRAHEQDFARGQTREHPH